MIHNSAIPPQRAPLRLGGVDHGLPDAGQFEAISAVLQAIPMAAVAYTTSYQLIDANEDCTTLLNLSDEVRGSPISNFIPESDFRVTLDAAQSAYSASSDGATSRPANSLRRLVTGDGRELTCWMHVGIASIGGYRCFVACIDLVNPVLSDAHRWRHRAEHDELTGLRRRGTLLDQVAQWIDSSRVVMLAFLDIDNFKSINDTHGHAAGDHVLITLARRLEQHAPPGCAVGRLSGDEFVLSQAVGDPADAYGRHADPLSEPHDVDRERLLAVGPLCVAEPIAWGDHLLVISISVGVTVSERGEDPATLLARADDAMYAQKAGSVRQFR